MWSLAGKEIQSDFDFTLICQNIHTGKEIQSDTDFTLICQNGGKRKGNFVFNNALNFICTCTDILVENIEGLPK
jgi:hypothetical protein